MSQVSGPKVLSKLDCNSGFCQEKLDKVSRSLKTFITSFGRFCFNRIPFGIILEGIEGQISNIEDILIRGKTQAKHQEVLKKLEGAGVTLNAEKCEFSKREENKRKKEDKIHAVHQGICRYRERGRESVWWPDLGNQIEDIIKICPTCCKHRKNHAEPMNATALPEGAWQKVVTDLFTIFKIWKRMGFCSHHKQLYLPAEQRRGGKSSSDCQKK